MMMRRVGSDVAPCGSGEERDRGWKEIDGAKKRPLFLAIGISKLSFHQDRLGTDIVT